MPRGLDILTHSRRECFALCRRKHFNEYECGYRPERTVTPLRYGDVVHVGLDWRAQGVSMDDIALRLQERYSIVPAWANERDWWTEYEQIIRLLYGYDWYWGNDDWEIVATEQVFRLPIRNPATGKASTIYTQGGKIDKIIRQVSRQLAVGEHKTTSKSIAPDSDYWKQIRLSQQVTGYYAAAKELGYDVRTIIWDAIHKPGMKPKDATPKEKLVFNKNGSLSARCREHDESLSDYGDRLAADIVKDPGKYFQRQEVPRTQGDVDEFQQELWDQQKTIREAERTGRHFRNTSACTTPYRCVWLDVCHYGKDIEHGPPEGFVQIDFVHPELEEHYGKDAESTTEFATTDVSIA